MMEQGLYVKPIAEVRKEPDEYEDLLNELDNDKFVLKKQYLIAQKFLIKLLHGKGARLIASSIYCNHMTTSHKFASIHI